MAVCGVDFGCKNVSIAQAERGGVTVLLNENSKRLNANIVSIQGQQRFLGEAAASVAKSNYKNTARNLRRFLGKKLCDVGDEIAHCPGVRFCEVDGGYVGIEVTYNDAPLKLSMPQLAGMMLFKMSEIAAQSNKGVGVADLVVSVPNWFDDAQRLAMLDACTIAGIRCLRLMNDLTATALEYGIWRSMQKVFDEGSQRVMFIDMGYSSFQVSIVEYVKGKLTVKAQSFDATLGGRDFDMAIAAHINEAFKAKYKRDAFESPKSRMKLLDAAEKAKMSLSPKGVSEASIYIECLVEEYDFSMKLPLTTFEDLVAPLLGRMSGPVDECLDRSETAPSALHAVEITGGASRVASVKRVLAEKLGLDVGAVNFGLKTTLNADECVSKGCAMMAAILSPRFKVKDYEVVDAAPFALKLAWAAAKGGGGGGAPMETEESTLGADEAKDDDDVQAVGTSATSLSVFDKNAPFPATKRITFRRSETFELSAVYEATEAPIGTFKVELPADAAADGEPAKVRVHVEYSQSGTLSVKQAQLVTEVTNSEEGSAATGANNNATAEEKKGGEEKEDEKKAEASSSSDAPPAAAEAAASSSEAKAGAESPGDGTKPAVKKRKYKKTPLNVVCEVASMSKPQIDTAMELEAAMANQDRVITETADMRNELEAYIYKMRDDVIGHLRPFVSDDDKAAFEAALRDAETWLYDGEGYDTSKSNYAARLEGLTKVGSPMVHRFTEAEKRPAELEKLSTKIAALEAFAAAPPAHVDSADAATVASESKAASAWLSGLSAQQSALAAHTDPVLTCSMLDAKYSQLDKATKAIVNKKAPPPAPAPAPPSSSEAKAPDAKQDAKQDDAPADKPDVDMPDAKDESASPPPPDAKDQDMPDASPTP